MQRLGRWPVARQLVVCRCAIIIFPEDTSAARPRYNYREHRGDVFPTTYNLRCFGNPRSLLV